MDREVYREIQDLSASPGEVFLSGISEASNCAAARDLPKAEYGIVSFVGWVSGRQLLSNQSPRRDYILESRAMSKNPNDSIVTSQTFSGSEGNRVNSTMIRNLLVFEIDLLLASNNP